MCLSVSPVKQPIITTLGNSSHEERERVNVRLASAFVMYFVLEWGDEGKSTFSLKQDCANDKYHQ